jgi:ABC-type nitrate/sulfonate/bicarbonate transport system substrate-binding protein
MKSIRNVKPLLWAAVVAVGALSAAACGSSSSGTSTATGGLTTVKVMMFPGQAYRLEPLVAEQQGYLKDHGIKMEITDQPPTLQGIQGLYASKSDVGQVTVGTLGQGVQAGDKAKFFCGGINVLQTSLMVPPDSKLPSTANGATWQEVLQSLKGKKIGIQTPVGSGLQLIFAAALKEAGVTDVTYVNLGGAPTGTIAALKNGAVDVAQANPPTTQYFEQSGAAKPILYMSDGPKVYADYYGSGWVAPDSWLQKNPKVASEFCAAMKEALDYIQNPSNKDSVASLFEKDSGLDAKTVDAMVGVAFKDFSTKLDKSQLEQTFSAYVDLGIFKPTPKLAYTDLVDDKSK